MQIDALTKFGLDESEAKVLLALLELGSSTVTEITKKAGITRTLGYHILEKLGWYGLVSRSSGKGAKIQYNAEHPHGLLQFIENKKNVWEKRLREAEKTLPLLLSLYNVAEKPIIRFQDGIIGVKTIFNETLTSKSEILSILDIAGWDVPELRSWGKEYNKERSKRRINERILILDTKASREWMRSYHGSLKYTDFKWIKPEQLPGIGDFGGEINIYENKIVMGLLKKPNQMGILIESLALANILRALFELAWKTTKFMK